MKKSPCLTLFFCGSILLAACQTAHNQDVTWKGAGLCPDSLRGSWQYDLSQPSRSFELPDVLREVSGQVFGQDSSLLLVQDETGLVFRLDLTDGNVSQFVRFAGQGDFEAMATSPDGLWVLRSDRRLFHFAEQAVENAADEKWDLPIPEGGDYEAMVYSPGTRQLLVVGKEPVVWQGQESDLCRLVFAVSPKSADTASLAFVMDLRDMQTYLDLHAETEELQDLKVRFNPEKKSSFKPSGMAIHPQTGLLYVVSAVGKTLSVWDMSGRLCWFRSLPETLFPQAEGITFGPDGTLYLSHEGPNGPARVHAFAPGVLAP